MCLDIHTGVLRLVWAHTHHTRCHTHTYGPTGPCTPARSDGPINTFQHFQGFTHALHAPMDPYRHTGSLKDPYTQGRSRGLTHAHVPPAYICVYTDAPTHVGLWAHTPPEHLCVHCQTYPSSPQTLSCALHWCWADRAVGAPRISTLTLAADTTSPLQVVPD